MEALDARPSSSSRSSSARVRFTAAAASSMAAATRSSRHPNRSVKRSFSCPEDAKALAAASLAASTSTRTSVAISAAVNLPPPPGTLCETIHCKFSSTCFRNFANASRSAVHSAMEPSSATTLDSMAPSLTPNFRRSWRNLSRSSVVMRADDAATSSRSAFKSRSMAIMPRDGVSKFATVFATSLNLPKSVLRLRSSSWAIGSCLHTLWCKDFTFSSRPTSLSRRSPTSCGRLSITWSDAAEMARMGASPPKLTSEPCWGDAGMPHVPPPPLLPRTACERSRSATRSARSSTTSRCSATASSFSLSPVDAPLSSCAFGLVMTATSSISRANSKPPSTSRRRADKSATC
mmetsp:Transcript_19049/g.52450  ORF Transcript_19049/g.52450 Transcript_19049/m.52450 type:complete len:348 (+) Transcript_19049:247-1290(+)